MCYVIITARSLIWFLTSLGATMLVLSAMVTPKWLVGPQRYVVDDNQAIQRQPSVGIYTRCTMMEVNGYHCGPFDIDGFATDSLIYPTEWKVTMAFMTIGFCIMCATVILTVVASCRQSIMGKSIHTVTGSAQMCAGILVMIGMFVYPIGWRTRRVMKLCGSESEAFHPDQCHIGGSFYSAIIGVLLCFIAAGISLKAESANMSTKVKRRVEEGERLVCVF